MRSWHRFPWNGVFLGGSSPFVEAKNICDGITTDQQRDGGAQCPDSEKRRLRESTLPLLGAFGRMTAHEYPVCAAERNLHPCPHPKNITPPSIRLLPVLWSEIWSKRWPFMHNWALRPPIVMGSLSLLNEMGSVYTSRLPKVTGSVGLA